MPERDSTSAIDAKARQFATEARKLKRSRFASQIKRNDPRLGSLVRSLDPTSKTLRDAASELLERSHAGDPSEKLRILHSLRVRIADLSRMPLEDELAALISKIGSPRSQVIAARRMGWDGRGGCTLEKAGEEYSLTRERVRQITSRVIASMARTKPFTPSLDRVIRFVRRRLPRYAEKIEGELVHGGFTRGVFLLEGVKTAAEILGRPLPFIVVELNDRRYVCEPGEAELVNRIKQLAWKSVGRWGVATIDDIVAQVEETLSVEATPNTVEAVLSGERGFQWLNRNDGWFWNRLVPRNRSVNQIRKILSVAPRIDVVELRAGVGRHHRSAGFSPPRRVLLELCRQLSGCRVEGDTVIADPPIDWRTVLAGTEKTMASILTDHGPVIQREKFEEMCLLAGMKRATFYMYLDYSPIITKYARGVYGLRGAPVPPGLVEELIPPTRRSQTLVDHGWTSEGKIWFAYRLSNSMIASGSLALPAAARRLIQGDYALKTEDGSLVGRFVVRDNGAWGLSALFRRRGGEAGDLLLLVVDLRNHQVTATIGDTDLLGFVRSPAKHNSTI